MLPSAVLGLPSRRVSTRPSIGLPSLLGLVLNAEKVPVLGSVLSAGFSTTISATLVAGVLKMTWKVLGAVTTTLTLKFFDKAPGNSRNWVWSSAFSAVWMLTAVAASSGPMVISLLRLPPILSLILAGMPGASSLSCWISLSALPLLVITRAPGPDATWTMLV